MKKESKILNQLVELTETGDITWKIKKTNSDSFTYSTVYKITDKKVIKISYKYHKISTYRDSIIFNYIDNNTELKREVKEVYPYNKFSIFDRIRLKWILKKLHKNIENTNPKTEWSAHKLN